MQFPSGRQVRIVGVTSCLLTLSMAALLPDWKTSLILSGFLLGVGVGLGDWKGGE